MLILIEDMIDLGAPAATPWRVWWCYFYWLEERQRRQRLVVWVWAASCRPLHPPLLPLLLMLQPPRSARLQTVWVARLLPFLFLLVVLV
jgi:hypothetical protein